ncbi:ferredoxin [Nocardia sp. BMG111209]|uniref:ferredoxin n=1 Tax=Nocardia sp. BMG111209 TaxID=1160137 RepID=UPI00035C9964|nr:ferredoxin [Nocardia sp. BMG111209]
MKINIDAARCEGHALCATIAPGIFEVGNDDLATVIDPAPDPSSWRTVRAAVDACPTLAISISENGDDR